MRKLFIATVVLGLTACSLYTGEHVTPLVYPDAAIPNPDGASGWQPDADISDGGQLAPDGGQLAPDGGQLAPDGGSHCGDGGGVFPDAGAASDGGFYYPDAAYQPDAWVWPSPDAP